ncbi:hypothetical protein Tco_1191750 [Tanacetum coccineum]
MIPLNDYKSIGDYKLFPMELVTLQDLFFSSENELLWFSGLQAQIRRIFLDGYGVYDVRTVILKCLRLSSIMRAFLLISEMLDDFDKQDVMDLHRLVEERYATSRPEGYDLMLWGDLKILFQPDEEDEVWRHQHEYNLISWRLFDSCGIHILLMDNGIAIHMMIEKKYPLTQEMLSKMLSRKLEVDHENEMVFELLRFIRSQVQK